MKKNMEKSKLSLYPVWVEINRAALLNNISQLKKNVKKYATDASF